MSPVEKRLAEDNKTMRISLWIVVIGILLGSIISAWPTRADSTFVPTEKAKPRVCEKVCPKCGGCIPMPVGRLSWSKYGEPVPMVFRCTNRKMIADTTENARQFTTPSCDSIIWGRWRTICRVDTIDNNKWLDSVSKSWGYRPDINVSPTYDTIYTDDPRCVPKIKSFRGLETRGLIPDTIPVIPSRGLDSTFNVKEKIWYYYNWSNGKRVNMRTKP